MLEVAAGGGYLVSPRALASADSSLWPCPYGPTNRPRLAPSTPLYAVWTFLSEPCGSERPSFLQALRSISRWRQLGRFERVSRDLSRWRQLGRFERVSRDLSRWRQPGRFERVSRDLSLRRWRRPTHSRPRPTGSSAKHTVGSSVLPPPPLPISLANTSSTDVRSITHIVDAGPVSTTTATSAARTAGVGGWGLGVGGCARRDQRGNRRTGSRRDNRAGQRRSLRHQQHQRASDRHTGGTVDDLWGTLLASARLFGTPIRSYGSSAHRAV